MYTFTAEIIWKYFQICTNRWKYAELNNFLYYLAKYRANSVFRYLSVVWTPLLLQGALQLKIHVTLPEICVRSRVRVCRRVDPCPTSDLRPADPLHHPGGAGQRRVLHVRGHRAAPQPQLLRVHHDEPGLRGPLRAPGQPQSALPHRRHDGARLRDDRRDHALLVRLHGREETGGEDRHDVPAVFGAALVAVPLRLRDASRQGRPLRSGKPQAEVPGRGRRHLGTRPGG